MKLNRGVKRIATNVDTRGWGSYLVCAGEIRPAGPYELLDASASLGKDHGVIDTSLGAGAANKRRMTSRGRNRAA